MPSWRYPLVLGCLFAVLSGVLGIRPHDPGDWILENAIAFAFVGALAATARRFPFSRISYTLIFVFLCLHTVGAHYTYSLVPYDAWFQSLTGRPLGAIMGWQRNHYDRLVHFTYGLLLAYPIREVFLRVAQARGFWGYFLPLEMTLATSALYEIVEWAAAATFGPEMGALYVGTQGDEWDAQKDMSLAAIGAIIAMSATGFVSSRIDRDFAREWAESLRVKRAEPLGEAAVRAFREREERS
jgi:putative membrane protein